MSLVTESASRSELDEEVSAMRRDRERDLRDLRATHSADLTAAREEGVRKAEEAAATRATEVRECDPHNHMKIYCLHCGVLLFCVRSSWC